MGPYKKGSERDKSKGSSIEQRMLVLHNDEINSFDHVMKSLQEICNHDEIQAEQCAVLTHLKGYCEIKVGNILLLENLRNQLMEKSLTVSIDTFV